MDCSKLPQPVPRLAVFQDPDFNIWCGSMAARGAPAVLFCAVADNPEKDGSYNVAIPLAAPTKP